MGMGGDIVSSQMALTFFLFLLLFSLIGSQKGKDDSSLGVDTHSRHYHPARTFHDMGPYMRKEMEGVLFFIPNQALVWNTNLDKNGPSSFLPHG